MWANPAMTVAASLLAGAVGGGAVAYTVVVRVHVTAAPPQPVQAAPAAPAAEASQLPPIQKPPTGRYPSARL